MKAGLRGKRPCTHEEVRQLAVDLVAIEQRLHHAGLHLTARKANEAVQRIGWEFAEQLEATGSES